MKTKSHLFMIFALFVLLTVTGYTPTRKTSVAAVANIGSCQVFPVNNYWNIPINNLPVHPSSTQWVNSIGANGEFHMDFGPGTWNGEPIGIPYNIVSGTLVDEYEFDFYYPDESDPGPYPLPDEPLIEGGGDKHILTVDTDDCTLYEIYDASFEAGEWSGGSGAIWSLGSNNLRPNTWTSADAAGLPILPGLARFDEVSSGVIEHALRFTANCTANYYLWPARHKAQHGSCANPVPFGARFRLKADYDISGFSPQAQVLLQAFKTYGIVLADNGSNWYVSGSPSESWDDEQLHELDVLTGSDFEAVDTSGLMVTPNSAATNHSDLPHVYSIRSMDANPTAGTVFRFEVYFSEPVTGVDPGDFSISVTGDIVGETVTGVTGSELSYIVTVSIDSGYGDIQLNLVDNNSIVDDLDNSLGGAGLGDGNFTSGDTYTRVIPSTIAITSTALYDGWILESGETSNNGGTMNSSGEIFYLGDDAQNRQYRAILHFDTSSLPDNAVIVDAKLRLSTNEVLTGTNPFLTHDKIVIELNTGAYSTSSNLQLDDFKLPSDRNGAGAVRDNLVNGFYRGRLKGDVLEYFNLTGATQIRLRFKTDDDDDNVADLIEFFSGNASASADRPRLVIYYYIP